MQVCVGLHCFKGEYEDIYKGCETMCMCILTPVPVRAHGCRFKPRAIGADYRFWRELQRGVQRALLMNTQKMAYSAACIRAGDRGVSALCMCVFV